MNPATSASNDLLNFRGLLISFILLATLFAVPNTAVAISREPVNQMKLHFRKKYSERNTRETTTGSYVNNTGAGFKIYLCGNA